MVFGVSYADDLRKVRELLQQIVAADPRILADPAPAIVVGELADSSVNFFVQPWVNNADYWDVKFAITEQVKLAFDEHGITIPYPQMDVHVQNPAAQAPMGTIRYQGRWTDVSDKGVSGNSPQRHRVTSLNDTGLCAKTEHLSIRRNCIYYIQVKRAISSAQNIDFTSESHWLQ